MRTSEDINELAAALAEFQKEVHNPKTTKTVNVPGKDGKPGYSYNYTPINDMLDSVREGLAKHGLSVLQSTGGDITNITKFNYTTGATYVTTGLAPYVVTLLMHKSGQWIESDMLPLIAGTGAQEIGSAISYARRYQLAAILGLATDDDDAQPERGVATIAPKVVAAAPAAHKMEVVDLSANKPKGTPLEEALNYAPFKSGADIGKAMKFISDGKLQWLMENEKTSQATRDKARLVLEHRGVLMPIGDDEPLAQERPEKPDQYDPRYDPRDEMERETGA